MAGALCSGRRSGRHWYGVALAYHSDSQLTAMGLQHLHARTNVGLELKVLVALLAAIVTNAN